jgi:hypothetical protein
MVGVGRGSRDGSARPSEKTARKSNHRSGFQDGIKSRSRDGRRPRKDHGVPDPSRHGRAGGPDSHASGLCPLWQATFP